VVPDGEPGELIRARPVHAARGTSARPEHNARAFTPDGFYRSRRPAAEAAVGQSNVVEGRGQGPDQPVSARRISAEEVENLILSHPAVLNVACVPTRTRLLGERMCACLVPAGKARSWA